MDWEAVERDYRTGSYTQAELAAKYGTVQAAVSQQVTTHGWTRDLTEQIRQATNAKLTQVVIEQHATRGAGHLLQSIDAAANINAAIVFRHRRRLEALARDADAARAKLMTMLDTVAEPREAATIVAALEAAIRSERILIEQERKSYRLDDETVGKGEAPKRVLIDFEDVIEVQR